MIKHLRKVGNSNALIFDKALLDLVGLEENADVQITVDNGSLVITPVNPKTVDKEYVRKSLDKLVAERGEVFESRAPALPTEFRFREKDVYVREIDGIVMLIPKGKTWDVFASGLDKFSDDYFAEGRNQKTAESREDLQ